MLSQGADPDAKDQFGYTPLMWACVRHRPDLSAVLLAAGANTETTNVWGRNAAFIAIWEKQTEIVAQFLERGMNISAAAEHDGWTALHKAAEMGHAAIVQMLLAKGADPLARTLPDEDAAEDAVGKTPLEVAKTEAVRELLREAEAAAEDAVLREAEDALKDEV